MSDKLGKPKQNLLISPDNLRGWITPVVKSIVTLGSGLGELFFGHRMDYQTKIHDKVAISHRAKQVDTYVFVWLLVEIICYGLTTVGVRDHSWIRLIITFLITIRIVDIVSTTIRIGLFDRLTVSVPVVASHARTIVLAFTNYIEILLCFACLFGLWPALIIKTAQGTAIDWFDPLYLSAITLLTVGYGDLHPSSWLRPIACLEAFSGLVLILLILGRFISILGPVENLDRIQEKSIERKETELN